MLRLRLGLRSWPRNYGIGARRGTGVVFRVRNDSFVETVVEAALLGRSVALRIVVGGPGTAKTSEAHGGSHSGLFVYFDVVVAVQLILGKVDLVGVIVGHDAAVRTVCLRFCLKICGQLRFCH